MKMLSLPMLIIMLLYADALCAGEVVSRVGPAENPDAWPDYGGTPDLDLSSDMSLAEAEISSLFERMKSTDPSVRAQAVAELRRNAPGSVAKLREVLFRGQSARNTEMKEAMREAERRAERDKKSALDGLITMDPQNQNLGNGTMSALRVVAMLAALNDLDTLAGYKVMIDFSPRHAGVFRQEIGRILVADGMKVMPALIYGRGSKDEETHMFAVKWIRDMGDPFLSEQMKIQNPRRLAQLLEAYASVHALDAIDVTLAMANHNSTVVSRAARSALKAYDRNALWPARRKYENTFSREPKADATVDAILSELYQHFDHQRLEKTMTLFEHGLKAYKEGNLDEMVKAYREVLRKTPMFPRRGEMATGFLAKADTMDEPEEIEQRKEALRMALRVASSESHEARRAEAGLLWLEAEELRKAGLVAPETYERILVFDPRHEGAAQMMRTLQPEEAGRTRVITKSLIVSFLIFLAGLLVFLRMRESRVKTR